MQKKLSFGLDFIIKETKLTKIDHFSHRCKKNFSKYTNQPKPA